ncbi:MAG: hypothetical protein M3Q65_20495, partial [Chloroflexota bacterium]|nr:hypothetical protein [Chloroflexota bacterium]
ALEDGMAALLPRPAARLCALELLLWVCTAMWLFRRGGGQPGEGEFSYHGRSPLGTFLWLVLLTAPLELLAWELLIPWAWLRLLLLVAGFYGALWIVGLYASLRVLPHRLEPGGVRLRHGLLADGWVPYDAIADVEPERAQPPGKGEGLRLSPKGTIAYLAVGGRTDLTLTLRTPRALDGFLRPTPLVSAIRLAADEPERLAAALRRRIAPAEGGVDGEGKIPVSA